jgi:DNA-binding transcriptional MerR regulator
MPPGSSVRDRARQQLHHYDKAGFLSPSDSSRAGYRLSSEADLVRLQQILLYASSASPSTRSP